MGQTVPVTENEAERLMAVRSILPFGIEATAELSALSELGQSVFSTTRAAVHIVDEDWLHIACQAGMRFSDCSRDISICTRVISTQKALIVPDLNLHPELKDLPYVKAGPCLRFYAGVPIELEAGLVGGPSVSLIRSLASFQKMRLKVSNVLLCWRQHCCDCSAPTSP